MPNADLIFLGRVASKQVSDDRNPDGTYSSVRTSTVRFVVLENFRSAYFSELEVGTTEGCCACGIEFVVGETYIVFANEYEGKLSTSSCTATQPAESAVALIWQLRARAKGRLTATLFGVVALQPRPHYRYEPVPIEALRGVEVEAVGTNGEFFAVTDAEGVYEFLYLPPDNYSIRAALAPPLSSIELERNDLRKIPVELGSSCQHNIWAQWNGRIAGRVVDQSGNPVPGFVALDYVEPKVMSGGAKLSGPGGYTTTEDGRFEFTLLGPDQYRLRFVPDTGGKLDFAKRITYPRNITLARGQQITDILIQVPWLSGVPKP
jgi:hypothetical protein